MELATRLAIEAWAEAVERGEIDPGPPLETRLPIKPLIESNGDRSKEKGDVMDIREVALELLEDAYEDEIAHLKLRMIRDDQAPRFEALRGSHPKIYEDFMKARGGPHEVLLGNRRHRVEVLRKLVEGGEGSE